MPDTMFSELYNIHRAAYDTFLGDQDKKSEKSILGDEDVRLKNAAKIVVSGTRDILEKERENSFFKKVMSNPKITVFEAVEELRRSKYRSYRKYLPHKFDDEYNSQVDEVAQLVPNVQHLKTNYWGLILPDNPVTGLGYGLVLGIISQEAVLPELLTPLERISGGCTLGLVTSSALNLILRNRSYLRGQGRGDLENARQWDTTQYLDMVVDLARDNIESLSNLKGRTYVAPLYHSLTDHQKSLAYQNLISNPFISRVGVTIGFGPDNSRVPSAASRNK